MSKDQEFYKFSDGASRYIAFREGRAYSQYVLIPVGQFGALARRRGSKVINQPGGWLVLLRSGSII